jgi:coenzyme F420-reducing hydrogenase delta subunit
MSNENGFEPQIVAFCCNYCAYAAADLAGASRLQYPPSIRIVLLPCTGKLDLLYALTAFENGADGIMVAGCLEGNCHFVRGNLSAKRRVQYVKSLLDKIGLGGGRIEMFNMSSAMGGAFAEAATRLTEQVKALGPNPLKKQMTGETGNSPPGA